MSEVIFKIGHITDLHLNPLYRIPRARTDDFHDQITKKFESLKEILVEEEIETLLISGDIFHLKDQRLYTPETNVYYQQMFEFLKVNIKTVPGNHDLSKSSYDNINKSAYKVLMEMADNVQDISMKKVSFPFKIKGKDTFVNILGLPFFPLENMVSGIKNFHDKVISKLEGINILLLHIDALPDNDIPLFWQTISYKELLSYMPKVHVACLGHIHQSFDVFSSAGQMISKPWAFSRVVNDAYVRSEVLEKLHKPSISIITFLEDKGKFIIDIQYRPIPCVRFGLAFKEEDLKRSLDKSKKIQSFVEDLKSQYGDIDKAFEIQNPDEVLNQLNIPKEVMDCIENYLEDKD
jgi:hypothetical protein